MDQGRHDKGVKNSADIRTKGMSTESPKESGWPNGPAWLQTDEENLPKPRCHVNETEVEQATSTVATEIKLDKLIDWGRYSSFNRIRNCIA